jgi:subtilase family serine protease
MKIRSLATGAVLGALALSSVSIQHTAMAAVELQAAGAASKSAVTHFTVFLPLTNTAGLEKLLQDQTNEASSKYHKWLTPAQFKQQFGPSRANVAKAKTLLEAAGLTVVDEKTQSLDVEGPVSAVEALFSTTLQNVKARNGKSRLAAIDHGRLNLPAELAAMGAIVPAFSPREGAHVHSHVKKLTAAEQAALKAGGSANPAERLGAAASFFYAVDMNEAYQEPSFQTEATPLFSRHPAQIAGVGSTIGIVISSVVLQSDVNKTFNSTVSISATDVDINNYTANSNLPIPVVTTRAVDGGSGAFNGNSDDAFEASLDTQMSLGTAPGAKEILYDMPDLSDQSIIDAYAAVDEDNKVDVVSSSFGECELDYFAAANGGVDMTPTLLTFHRLFQQGNAQGITFLASSGDNGAPLCNTFAFDNKPQNGTSFVLGVSTPANDPNVTGVGGTNLQVSPTPTPNDSTYLSENANFDPRLPAEFDVGKQAFFVDNNTWGSGGGFSQFFSKPLYQFLVSTGSNTKRSVPDVSLMMGGCPGDADLDKQDCTSPSVPRSAAIVWVAGIPELLIGTSSSSPQMAGVLALAVELNGGRLGNVNPLIYSLSAIQTLLGGTKAPKAFQYFHRNVSGNNNGYTVKPGQAYSEVLGNGTLDVKNFLGLPNVTPAGAPSTPSNP